MSHIPVFSIDTDVPVPKKRQKNTTRSRVPVDILEVGESILFPLNMRQNVQILTSRLKKLEGKQYTVQKVDDDHARVWRVA